MFPSNKITRAFTRKGFNLIIHSRFADNAIDKTHIELFRFSKDNQYVEVSFCINNNYYNSIKYIENVSINEQAIDDVEQFCKYVNENNYFIERVRNVISFIREVMKRGPKIEIIHGPDNNGVYRRRVYPQLFKDVVVNVQPVNESMGLKFAMQQFYNYGKIN